MYFSISALCYYDYCLNISREVELIWKAKLSLGTILYYTLRYPAMLFPVAEIMMRIFWPWQSDQSCRVLLRFNMALDLIVLSSVAVFAALRVYAMHGRSGWLSALTLVSGLINPAIFIYLFTRSIPSWKEVQGFGVCNSTIAGNNLTFENWAIVARAASLVSDGFVLSLTYATTLRAPKRFGPAGHHDGHGDITTILLRDSLLYFSILFTLNLIGIGVGHITASIEILMTWTAILTSVLLSRLMLNLRELSLLERSRTEMSQSSCVIVTFSTDILDSTEGLHEDPEWS